MAEDKKLSQVHISSCFLLLLAFAHLLQGEPFDLDDEPITGCVRCCV